MTTDATPCGEDSVFSCRDPRSTFERHEHGGLLEVEYRNSHGAEDFRAQSMSRAFDAIDAQVSNWCPTCQTTLMLCTRAGCENAYRLAVTYAYIGAAYAHAAVRAKFGSKWTPTQDVQALQVAERRALSRLNGKFGDPENWTTGKPSSLVNWFGAYARRDIKSHITSSPDESSVHEVLHDVHDYLWEAKSGTYDDQLAIEREVARDQHTADLRDAYSHVVDLICDSLFSAPTSGAKGTRPLTVMLEYLADIEQATREGSTSSGVARTSDRAIARHLGLTSNKTIDRIRTLVLIPSLETLRDDPDRTEMERRLLITILDHLNNQPLTLDPLPSADAHNGKAGQS